MVESTGTFLSAALADFPSSSPLSPCRKEREAKKRSGRGWQGQDCRERPGRCGGKVRGRGGRFYGGSEGRKGRDWTLVFEGG
ncbi:hypothetical protein IE53DRAFT_252005 [Violaceomyces palustris]|uniref:Uncharacterized protein n=1 Tax=Violaceomyces palustris TaxID=1673888 RepID=A0ACD0P471_9BASI|nr:hypothetical protein IE53DRAFT_252005 [Violaceomyces palustris]